MIIKEGDRSALSAQRSGQRKSSLTPFPELLISTIAQSGFDQNNLLSPEVFRQIADHSVIIWPDIYTTPAWKGRRDAPSDPDYRFYLNVIRLQSRTYILATPSRRAEEIVLRRPSPPEDTPLDVYVLQYRSRTDIPMICHFRHPQKAK